MASDSPFSPQLTSWMEAQAQMSQYPPPPTPDHQHYTPIYPAAVAAATAANAQLLSPAQAEQLQYSPPVDPSAYAKIEPSLGASGDHLNHAHQPEQQPVQQAPPAAEAQPKANRLRKACDSCSIRKVKCDETGPPCRACAALDIPCTFERPSRRRGPPNRHAEAIKKRRIESPYISGPPSPSSPTHAAQALAALSSVPTLSAESICTIDIIELLVNDFFTYIHPLCPFPHEQSFREAFRKREDYTNRPFLALLASMIGALVASFPRKPRQHLKARGKDHMFPNAISLVNRCQQVCTAARGAGYLEKEDLNVYDAATSYFLGLMGAYTFRWRQMRLYFSEALSIIRGLRLHVSAEEQSYAQLASMSSSSGPNGLSHDGLRNGPPDYITQELSRRIFWTVFVGLRSLHQIGAWHGETVIPPPTRTDPYPPLPREVDDAYIYPTHIEQFPPGAVSQLTGFNANVRVYLSLDILEAMEIASGIEKEPNWDTQKKILNHCLGMCKGVLHGMPPELTVWLNASHSGQSNHGYYPPTQEYLGHRDLSAFNAFDMENSPEERRRVQFEIQKANIYASQLSTRSYIVEKFFTLHDVHSRMKTSRHNSPGVGGVGLDGLLQQAAAPPLDDEAMVQEMAAERESIIKDLLVMLGSISQVHMEPSAESFIVKIRLVASTLLDLPKDRKGSVALQAEQYLAQFLEILVRLERVSPANSDPEHPEDEESELRHWADLKEYQTRFAQAGGVLGFT